MQNFKIAIQGELGSNSHMAAISLTADTGRPFSIVPCALSIEVFERLHERAVDLAVLPIENSLHGSVFEHYDLLLQHGVTITAETLLRIRHNVIATPGATLSDIRRVLSHPVALSQCRRWLRAHPHIEVVPFYDTAGSVKHLMERRLEDAAAIAPELAAQQYGAHILLTGVEDHVENYTRFYSLDPGPVSAPPPDADKVSLAFSIAHRPGTLIGALELFRDAGLNLSKIESRPVPGRPWEYVFFVDIRFTSQQQIDHVLPLLRSQCEMVRELGRYRAA